MRKHLLVISLMGYLFFLAASFALDHMGHFKLALCAVGLAFVCIALMCVAIVGLLMRLHYRSQRRSDNEW
jgi:uncharacterized iron-regulated membrane protein